MEAGEEAVDGGGVAGAVVVVFADTAGGRQHPGHVQQLTGVEHAALVRPVEGGGYVLHPGKIGAAVKTQTGPGGVGLVQQQRHLVGVGGGEQLLAPLLGRRTDGVAGEHFQHGGQFQRADGLFKQFTHSLRFLYSNPMCGSCAPAGRRRRPRQPDPADGGRRRPGRRNTAS